MMTDVDDMDDFDAPLLVVVVCGVSSFVVLFDVGAKPTRFLDVGSTPPKNVVCCCDCWDPMIPKFLDRIVPFTSLIT